MTILFASFQDDTQILDEADHSVTINKKEDETSDKEKTNK